MTQEDIDGEIGRTLREYKEASERIGCLLSRLSRIAEAAERVGRAGPDPGAIAQVSQDAAEKMGDGDVVALFRSIAEAAATKRKLFEALQRQGIAGMLHEERGR